MNSTNVCVISSYNISREDLFDSKNPYVPVKIVCCVKFCLGREKRKTDTERTCARVAIRATSFYFETKIAT